MLQTKDLKSLPIIVIDEEIVKYGAYLSVEELEKLTNIGMSIQEDNGVNGT
ncbi:hypothetical protein CU025_1428 [Enterococcus faecium]|nr:hypothetical protein [Enterococcus faecium]MBK4766868.1 hypothetical protein [Enterococcus faecium]MBK4801911.1 hypothetical protein [Enterococcus faecium]MBK4811893.1 hypothetical protein [Enterococcus faecium]MBK4822733.1 hypothetical protein [Enterococcus faecium]